MRARDALVLGRVSNLPTVWTNMLAGVALSGSAFVGEGAVAAPVAVALFVALTLFYVGGMYLNDAFDAELDAEERSERPIPSGRVSRGVVFVLGYTMLVAGLVLLGIAGHWSGTGWGAAAAGIVLAGAIVFYNAYHKSNPLSPLVMGVCRMMVYVAAAATVVVVPPAVVWTGAAISLGYLIGLTYVAKQENLGHVANLWPVLFLAAPLVYGAWLATSAAVLWLFVLGLAAWIVVALRFIVRRGPGDIPRAVVSLIAGISLLDALLIAASGLPGLALVAVAGFALTLALQRFVPGT